ncbi:MAG: hypothetical protein MI754_01860 [Chromatiales bacterium]|nr:hypothetical protein [Chromatiales bacterium]
MGTGLRRLFSRWRPGYEKFVAPLHVNTPNHLEFGLFKKGIDNVHIDVALSKEFKERTRILVAKMLQHYVAENCWGERPPAPDGHDSQALKDSYAGVMEVAVANASQHNQPERIQLLQLAVIKFFLFQIDQELERLREQLRGVKGHENHDSTGRSVEAHDRLVILAKSEPDIRYKIARKLFREMLWVERSRASKLRKSVLGSSWQLPKLMLFNPLLQLPSLSVDAQLMHHYTLVCTAKDDLSQFAEINRLLIGLFADYLPDWCQPVSGDFATPLEALADDDSSLMHSDEVAREGSLMFNQISRMLATGLQPDEYQKGQMSWLDSPQNIDKIIYSERPWARYRFEGSDNIINSSWVGKRWTGYYNRLLQRIFRRFGSKRLANYILACQEAPALYKELREQVPVRLICDYLARRVKRRGLQRQLAALSPTISSQHIQKVLDQAAGELTSMPAPRRRKHILAFLHQFAQLRRDLKLAYHVHLAMNRIRILDNEEALELSRSNNTLYQFALTEEVPHKHRRIRNHVIIKADVRGSTKMTEQLKKKGLNPATHFSLNFFEPITKLLPAFGAKKVFVEGDAVILSIYEYEDTPFQWLCIAHACGLARHILQVVDAQNIQNRRYDLPELELGLGIAFSDQSPAFLYDEEQEILISSAINRADQLSSCSAMIKRSDFARQRGRGIEVFSVGHGDRQHKETSDRLTRYNVNGIELDLPAFYKLKSEVTLRKISARDAGYASPGSSFYAGRYPDMEGRMHWLVVREAPVCEWGGDPVAAATEGRRFYEVITDEEIIKDIKARAGGERGSYTAESKGAKAKSKLVTNSRHYL